MDQKRGLQSHQHLTSPHYTYTDDDMLQFLAVPENDVSNDISQERYPDTYYNDQIDPSHNGHTYRVPEQALRIDVGLDSTPKIDIDSSYLYPPAPGNGVYRSHPTSPSISSSRGSSPYPSSTGSLSPYSAPSPLISFSPADMSSSSFESLHDSMSLLNYHNHIGSSSDSQLGARSPRSFYDVGSNPTLSPYPSSSSLPLFNEVHSESYESPSPRLARQDTLVNEAFLAMELITKQEELNKKPNASRHMREEMRNRLIDNLHQKLPSYRSMIDAAASKSIGTMANREASQRRKKKKGVSFYCLLCKECRDFTTKDNFMTHIRVHFGAKLSECKRCGHEFPNKTVPKRHRTTCEANRGPTGDH